MDTATEKYFEYRHVVGFEETNIVGNVYYTNYLSWQGRCREMFLKAHAPEVLEELGAGLKLFTLKVDCEFYVEITAFDEIAIRMRLTQLAQTQLEFGFEYLRIDGASDQTLIARGRQRVACMRASDDGVTPVRVPAAMVRALAPYAPG